MGFTQNHAFIYIFVRRDLSLPSCAVQSVHSVIEASKVFDLKSLPDHPSVIIIGIKSEQKLQQVRKYLVDNDVRHVHFYEPDLNNELTSIATEPIFEDRRKLFRKFQLLKENNHA